MGADLSATIEQSAADKLVGSVTYPFKVFQYNDVFHSPSLSGKYRNPGAPELPGYTDQQILDLFARADDYAKASTGVNSGPNDGDADGAMLSQVVQVGGTVIESAKACRRALEENPGQYKGPDKAFLDAILNGGLAQLPKTLAVAPRGIQLKPHLSEAHIFVNQKPSPSLQGNAIATGAVIIAGGASGEIWWYHPTFHCSWLCFNWSTTWSWDVLVSASIDNVRFDVDARIDVGTSGAIVQVTGQFNKLRLDYPIFDQIPIENYINPYLTTKTLAAFDASQFVACMPVLNSKFRVDTVTLSPAPAQLAISVTVKQVG